MSHRGPSKPIQKLRWHLAHHLHLDLLVADAAMHEEVGFCQEIKSDLRTETHLILPGLQWWTSSTSSMALCRRKLTLVTYVSITHRRMT